MERAWAAGFFDGEGSVSTSVRVYNSKLGPINRTPIACSMAQLLDGQTILERFRSAVGSLGKVQENVPEGKKYNRIWVWNANAFGELQTVAGVLWPYLSTPKKAQFSKAILKYAKDFRDREKLPLGAAMHKVLRENSLEVN